MPSNAVGLDLISRVVGYKITKGDFRTVAPNLPQRIAILGEANEDKQASLTTAPVELKTAKEAGDLFGYGSPIHMAMRILKPLQSDGVGGIPVVAYPQLKASGSTATVISSNAIDTYDGVALEYIKLSDNDTFNVTIAGRSNLDGFSYSKSFDKDSTIIGVLNSLRDNINSIVGCPFTASVYVDIAPDNQPATFILTSKWKGKSSSKLNATISSDTVLISLSKVNGTGQPLVTTSLNLFSNEWNTIVVNTYGTETAVLDELENFNGVADPTNPTGRYRGIVFKPFIALTGSVADNDSTITDARSSQMTVAICPAPLSQGHSLEAAANMCYLLATTSNENPHLDVCGLSYPDMPTPSTIGTMQSYENRDIYVKKGNSTVDLVAGKYQVQDFVTTYHLAGEQVPQFRFVRNLMLDYNVRYGYFLLEQTNVVDHVIVNDDDVTNAPKVVKPKQWKAILFDYADNLSNRALIADASFMQESIEVDLSSTNPDRLETFFRYKRSGVARISSTTAEAGFNFGN